MESWQWLNELNKIKDNNQTLSQVRFEDVVSAMVSELPALSKIREYMPDADFRMLNAKIPRQTMRNSGRTAMNAHLAVSETRVPHDNDSPLSFSMEGRPEDPPSSLVPFYWTPGWNSVQAFYKYVDEPNGSMKGGDPGIRLIEPAESHNDSYFRFNPGPENELK
jgi:NADH-quinone oxidoreductase subunit G